MNNKNMSILNSLEQKEFCGVVVFKTERVITMEYADRIKKEMNRVFPDKKVVLLDGGSDIVETSRIKIDLQKLVKVAEKSIEEGIGTIPVLAKMLQTFLQEFNNQLSGLKGVESNDVIQKG